MDRLLFATRAVSLGDEVKQNDAELVSDIERLLNITGQLVDSMENFIIEVHVSPMSMLQSKFKDIKKLKFSIVYNQAYEGDVLKEKMEDCSGLIEAFARDEFEGIEQVEKTDYSTRDDWEYPTLLVYSVFGSVSLDDIMPKDLATIQKLCEDGYAVSIPVSFMFEKTKGIIIHCADGIKYTAMIGALLDSERQYGQTIKEFTIQKKYKDDMYYIPMIGTSPIKYNIPYIFITKSDFGSQENSSDLKD